MQAQKRIHDYMHANEDPPEYDYMWNALSKLPINSDNEVPQVCLNEEAGEAWQYMGTHEHKGKFFHEFRHRCHPKSNSREYIRIPIGDDLKSFLTPSSI